MTGGKQVKLEKKQIGNVLGQTVHEYTLTNNQGVSLSALNFGGIINSIKTPDKNGKFSNITLSLDNVEEHIKYQPYYGAIIGRVAGRVANGRFTLDGNEYQLQRNNQGNHLHGGIQGFDSRIWDVEMKEEPQAAQLIFSYLSPDGESGYPGNLRVTVTYTLTNDNVWKITYEAETDKPTLFNPTNHVYFNLSGDHSKTIRNHILQINSDMVGEIESSVLPTGKTLSVEETDFDFREGTVLNQRIESENPQILAQKGFDHPFKLSHLKGSPDVVLYDPESERKVSITTDRDAVVVYTHSAVNGEYSINNQTVQPYAGVALETQTMPDAIHHDGFGNIVLLPGEKFYSETNYKFQ